MTEVASNTMISAGLYTPEERLRRDNTIWTPVQGFWRLFSSLCLASVCV